MPHLEGQPQHFFKSAEDKSIHRHKKLEVAKKMKKVTYKRTGKAGGNPFAPIFTRTEE